ncbi:peptidoglycan-binding protein [Planctomycetota bacterium]
MRETKFMAALSIVSFYFLSQIQAWESALVHYSKEGKLQYSVDSEGNRIPDFSYAGYKRGETELPDIPVVHTISPIDGDNTEHIQKAIDHVGAMPKDKHGFRGALLLTPGIYSTDNPVRITYDGVIIRGSGRGDDPLVDTIIYSTRTQDDSAVIEVGIMSDRSVEWTDKVPNSRVVINDALIPIGQRHFTVKDASQYKVGDHVVIVHIPKPAWFDAIDNGGTVKDPGWSVTYKDKMDISYSRFITDIKENQITVDAPFFYPLKSSHANSMMYKYDTTTASGKLYHQVGIEDLRIDIETQSGEDEKHTQSAVNLSGVIDGWVKSCEFKHFKWAGVNVTKSLYVTVENCSSGPPVSKVRGGRRYNFCVSGGGQLILFKNNTAMDCRHGFISNGGQSASGITVIKHNLIRNITGSEGHKLWTQGILFDNCKVTSVINPDSRTYTFFNRGDYGTSHGWGTVNSVVWNTDTSAGGEIVVQKPPTAQNYAIGCSGAVSGDSPFPGPAGFIEGTNEGETLRPQSLYQAQLADRLEQPQRP